jgi:monoamine oxidase
MESSATPDSGRVTRRAVLAAAAGLSAMLVVPPPPARADYGPTRTSPRPSGEDCFRVVVVGAGLAGLSCALELTGMGWHVTVLEARDRVGGRVHTWRDRFGPGTRVEAGGEFIDRDHRTVLELLSRFGLTTNTRDRSAATAVFWAGRRTRYSARVDSPSGDLFHDIRRVTQATARLAAQIDPEHPERSRHAERLDAMTLAQWADGLGLSPLGRKVWEAGWIASDYGTTSQDMSLLFYAQQECFGSSNPADIEVFRVAEGNDALARAIAKHLTPARVHLSEPVTHVRVGSLSATVSTARRAYDCARVVVATPPPPLRAIQFDPPLVPALGDAIDSQLLDPITKVAVAYLGHPWRRAGWTGESLAELPFTYSWDATDSQPAQANGVLVAFSGGRGGRALTRMDPASRIDAVRAQLRQVFPETAGREHRSQPPATVAWASEPYTGGGYANYRPGQMLTAKPAFQAAYGPLRFAGEHTEAMGQYMESAARSGRRVARAIGPPPRAATSAPAGTLAVQDLQRFPRDRPESARESKNQAW